MSDLRNFLAIRADDLARQARLVEEWDRVQLAIVAESAPINPPAGLHCAICERPITDLNLVCYGGETVTHAGICQFRMDLRLAEVMDGFDFLKWIDE